MHFYELHSLNQTNVYEYLLKIFARRWSDFTLSDVPTQPAQCEINFHNSNKITFFSALIRLKMVGKKANNRHTLYAVLTNAPTKYT